MFQKLVIYCNAPVTQAIEKNLWERYPSLMWNSVVPNGAQRYIYGEVPSGETEFANRPKEGNRRKPAIKQKKCKHVLLHITELRTKNPVFKV